MKRRTDDTLALLGVRARALPLTTLAMFALSGCGGSVPPPVAAPESAPPPEVAAQEPAAPPRQEPPASGPARDVRMPTIVRAQTRSGLELDTVRFGDLPLVYLRLVVRSGSASDPADLPGLAQTVANMLKEGTRTRTSAQLAEEIDFLGAVLEVDADSEQLYVAITALSEHLERAMTLLADIATSPRFAEDELARLKRRELDRLALSQQQPRYLAYRTFYGELYGSHPYARIDATPASIERMTRAELARWHRTHVVPNNSFLIAVGDVQPEQLQQTAERAFRAWRPGTVPETQYAAPPARTAREVIVVDRPESVQSMIYVGNLAIARNDPAFVPLTVANQVLGGSAASRLFMDLRERRSLTYGAYSRVAESVQVAPFIASASVRNEVTEQAMAGFMEHLDQIVAEAPPEAELRDAERYLSDSFPLQIETTARIAYMVEELRAYGLPDDYWDTYRTSIRAVTPAQAHEAARAYIQPERALVVAVGRASAIVEPLRRYGPVRVIDVSGNEVARFPALAAGAPAQ